MTYILCPLLFKIGNCKINPRMKYVVCLWIIKCDFLKNLSPWWFAVSAAVQSNYRVIPQGNIRKSYHFSSFLEWMKVLLFYKSLSCTKSTCKPIKYQTADVVFLCLGKQLFRITVKVRMTFLPKNSYGYCLQSSGFQ
jgi:hypothetical protein